MKKLNKTKKQQGFTLIELMIVVAVIGVLAAIAVPQYQKYVAKSEAATALASITGHRTNVETYVLENGSFPTANSLAVPTSPLGTVSYVSASSSSGGIQFLFKSTGVSPDVVSKKVTLSRTTAGAWTCSTNVDSDLKPKGC
ncbi:pilin [Vibrio vulnificus]|uniref:pilin n=1 Tax=Vibrio vulnificus TaxID=672 RepID=UPI001A34123C|nr:pilin [Vibrio vulnificus]MCA0770475.1 pilin [Vibrio vulnificus]HAS6188889.1 prepilin-type N-terminal cleavage/methylation domain-containing protein [Vibrio vulnificus]HAS6241889.1 prepilin-type N-terminal cleavage/methylation domain-containing protein [Vibrio vulnificus]HDY7944015.1 pilin [Vibrio vulnificus]